MKTALWQKKLSNGKIRCELCPRYCTLDSGQKGFCFIRENIDGEIKLTAYGKPLGFAIDPIEKKPLFHFLPGTEILSFGTAGCNLGCKFCQNWTMSKAKRDYEISQTVYPEHVVALAKKYRVPSIAYTYNEPIIFGEYVIDISRIAREENIKNVMVTAGYIMPEARKDVFKYIDAANVDLKGFSEEFYRKYTLSHLEPVLDTLKWIKNETAIWLEITTLLIPGANDSYDELKAECDWIVENLGDEVPLHFTAFHPDFKMRDVPATSYETLAKAKKIAEKSGIKYCYLGNVSDTKSQTTFCPHCGTPLIKRNWHSVYEYRLDGNRCPVCGTEISGVFQ